VDGGSARQRLDPADAQYGASVGAANEYFRP
jgi:hypothetical protein